MKTLRWVITAGYAGVIFYLSSQSWTGVKLFTNADKLIHIVEYAAFGFLCLWSLRTTSLRHKHVIVYVAAAAAALYGATDEIHQYFVPGREASVIDFLLDAVGAFIGAYIAAHIAKKIRGENERAKN